jgi:hypothetical protein
MEAPLTMKTLECIILGRPPSPEAKSKRWLKRDILLKAKPGTEMVPEPNYDETIVYEDFFVTGLRMPPHPALGEILLHFQAQLHQLTPNAIAQLSKYLWAIGSFGGMPRSNAFVKRYELHYQPKKGGNP